MQSHTAEWNASLLEGIAVSSSASGEGGGETAETSPRSEHLVSGNLGGSRAIPLLGEGHGGEHSLCTSCSAMSASVSSPTTPRSSTTQGLGAPSAPPPFAGGLGACEAAVREAAVEGRRR